MTRFHLSKFIRKINNIPAPQNCFAIQYIPQSLNDVCDCKIFCKYGPKNGNFIPNLFESQIKYNTIRQ